MEAETPALKAAQDRVKRLMISLEKAEARAAAAEARARDAEARAQEAEAQVRDAEANENLPARTIARLIANSLPRRANRNYNARVICLMLALEEGPLSVTQIRKALGVAQASASDWIREATEHKVVEIVPANGDKRTHLVKLTPKGRVWARDRRVPLPTPPAEEVLEDEPEDAPDALDALDAPDADV